MPYKKFILTVMTTKLRLGEILKEENCYFPEHNTLN